MITYTISNLKGGVGKTTSTVNLAYSMAILGKRVLVIDADPQTNLTPFYAKANPNGKTILDVFRHPERIRSIICRTKYDNIDIIKGSIYLKEADPVGDMILSETLQLVSDNYDVCLIDTRPAIETITKNALQAADVIVTPVLLDQFCRDNLLLLEDELNQLSHMYGFKWCVFANKVVNKRFQKNIYADMVGKHSLPFLDTCISRGAVVENALEQYKPVMKHRSRSNVAEDYMDLAKELLGVGGIKDGKNRQHF